MPKRNKKMASLSGSLLVQQGSDPKVGFVLRSLDDVGKQPTGSHSDEEPKQAESPEQAESQVPKPASDRPSLYAVAQEDVRQPVNQTARVNHMTLVPASVPEPDSGTADQPSGASLDSCGLTAKSIGPRDFLAALRQGSLAKAESIFGHLTGLDPVRTKPDSLWPWRAKPGARLQGARSRTAPIGIDSYSDPKARPERNVTHAWPAYRSGELLRRNRRGSLPESPQPMAY